MKFTFPINNFSMGEWSPKMRYRADLPQYQQACEELTNFIPQAQGGAQFRGGIRRIDVSDAAQLLLNAPYGGGTHAAKLIPYSPSVASRRATVFIDPGITNVIAFTEAQPSVAATVTIGTYGADTFANGNIHHAQVGDYLFMADNYIDSSTRNKQPLVFYHSGSDYRCQGLDVIREFEPWRGSPWTKINALGSNVTLSFSATTGAGVTCTASTAFFLDNKFINSYIRLCKGTSDEGIAMITGWTSGTVVTVTILKTLTDAAYAYGAAANPTSFWQISAWNDYYGWPRTVTSFQGRVIFGGTLAQPDTIWGSRVGNPFDFQEIPSPNTTGVHGFASDAYTADNTRPFTLTPSTMEPNVIVAMGAAKTLAVLTERGEIMAYGQDGAFGPNNATFDSSSSFGADDVQPVRVNNLMAFVQGTGRAVRDITFNFQEEQYKSTNLSFGSDHLLQPASGTPTTYPRFEQLVKVEGRTSILYARDTNFGLWGCSIDRDAQISGWFRITIGLEASDAADAASVYSICLSADGTELTMLMARDSKLWLCKMQAPYDLAQLSYSAAEGYANFLDFSSNAVAGAATPTTSWQARSGATNRLAGKTVDVLADGKYVGTAVVASDATGTFTCPVAATSVVIGFKYTGIIKTMPIQQGGQWGLPIGRHKRVDEMEISFIKSFGCKFGKDVDALDEVAMWDQTQNMEDAPRYFTGEKVVTFPTGYERSLQVVIKQDQPYPCYIRGVTPRGVTYD